MSGEADGRIVALAIKAALAPLQAQLAALLERGEAQQARLAVLEPAVATLRERVAVAEARPPVPGPPGADGATGADGFTPDELTVSQDPDDERVITLGYRRGDQVKHIGTVRLQAPRYCGVYDKARAYLPGDQVTHAGSLWHCHAPTRSKPGEGDDGWQLQVKRGEGR
jgi:hypothetical protein